MSPIDYISRMVEKLRRKYRTRDPYELCSALGVRIRLKDLGTSIKAYYFYQSRIRSIVLNWRVSEPIRRILVAHELGHDQLHNEIAMLKGFQEIELFDMERPAEYEANVFAAELLIDEKELLELLNDDNKSFFDVARELYIPAALLDFKFRVLKHKGYRIEAPYIANGDFLKNNIDGCFDE
ncbi:MAG: ImmA/IrrE family metallo-endopeptidase, partial [Synergistaceae bacterium]|nr:ImmA/IrrE family metallo-endopeptidase [Synergistaceae bacterium]